MKSLPLFLCLLFFSFCFAQKTFDCNLRTYLNNDNKKIGEIKFFMITHKDTIETAAENNKVVFPKLKENFNLEMHFENHIMKIGAYRPSDFQKNINLIIGKVTDIHTLKKMKRYPDAFLIDGIYPLFAVKQDEVEELIYCMIQRNVLNADGKNTLAYEQYTIRTKLKK